LRSRLLELMGLWAGEVIWDWLESVPKRRKTRFRRGMPSSDSEADDDQPWHDIAM